MKINLTLNFFISPLASSDNILTRLQNAVAFELNTTVKLPRIVVVILDRDFSRLRDSQAMDVSAKWVVSSLLLDVQQ